MATALELGLNAENKVINVYEAEFLDQTNPLRQIPTLILDDGRAIFDSRVIVAYFCSLRPGRRLNPIDERWDVQTRWALAVGLMEASVGRVMELRRPEAQRNSLQLEATEWRISNAISYLEANNENICSDTPRIDRIASAVALEYIDFRLNIDWRECAPHLAEWLKTETERPSMAQTRPRESL